MKKIAYLLTLILSVCSFFMFGCTNKYKNLKIELDNNEIVIDVAEGEESFETVTATVKGAGKGVSTAVIFSTQSTNITLEPQEQENNATECKIIANPDGTGNSAVVTVATLEGGKTATVNVTIVRKIQSATYNTAYNPAVSLNGRLQINTGLAISMVPENTTQDQFTYTLNGQYEDVSLSEGGELVVGSVMPADGKIKITATNTEKRDISVNFEVSVVKGIGLREQVTIQTDGKVLDNGLIIEPNKQSWVTVKFGTTMSGDESYYSFLVSSQNENIIPTPVATSNLNEFTVVASSIGETALTVTVYVTGYNASFASFTFDLPVIVKNVPTGIVVTTKNGVGASTIVGATDIIEIYDVYADGVLGTQLTTVLTPTPTHDSDSTFSINILGQTDAWGMIDVYYSDETKVEDLLNLPSSVNLFFRVKETVSLTETINFQLEIVSDFDKDLKQVVNIKLIKGISQLNISRDGTDVTDLKIVLGETANLIVSAKGSNQESLEVTPDNVKLDFGTTGAEFISSQRNTEKPEEFAITANKCGTTNIVFFTNNGVSKEIEVIVYQPYTTFVANYQMPNSDIGDQTYYLDGESINSVKTLVFALSSSLKINITYFADAERTTPVNATIIDAYIVSQNVSAVAVFDKLYITGLKAEVYSNLTLHIVSYDENGEVKTDTLAFTAKSYVPLSQVQLNYNSLTLLDSNTLSALDRSEGEAILELRLSPINATFNSGDDITWAVAGATSTINGEYVVDGHIVKLDNTNLRNNQTKVSVYLSDTIDTATITVVATAKQYSRSYTQSCTITVRKCVQIDNLEITNLKEYIDNNKADYDLYFNATKGLADVNNLSEIAISEGATNYFDIKTRISPSNVTNSQVVYVIKNWNNESDTEITNAQKSVVLVSSSGRVYANTAGYAKIYVIPSDSLTEAVAGKPTIEYNRTTYSYNADLTKIIYVQVADGSENNKIRLESASDFIGINTINGLKLHYELHNNIDLASVGAVSPIGFVSVNNANEIIPFTGSLTGCLESGHSFAITNVSLNMAAFEGVYIGLFANIAAGAKVENLTVYVNSISHTLAQTSSSNIGIISAINNGKIKNCEINVNNLTASNLAGQVCMGAVAGLNNGYIENCKVSGDINLTYTTGITSIKFGGIAGQNSGTIKADETGDSTSNETQYLVSYNFSDVDVTLNITSNNPNIKINESEDFSAVSFGGIVGQNNGTVNGLKYGGILKGYSKLGGIAGTNAGLIENCVNQGNVYSQGGSYVGGIVAYNQNNGNLKDSSVQAFNYVGKTLNHTALVGYNHVGVIVGYNNDGNIADVIENCYLLSYYSLRTVATYTLGTSNYETDNLNGTHYYGDMLVLNANGIYNTEMNGITAEEEKESGNNYCDMYVQVVGTEPHKIIVSDSVNTVPTSISASVKINNTIFSDAPTKVNESTLLIPYFESIAASQEIAQTLYAKNTYNIADLITVACTPINATQKFIVQTSNSSAVSLDKQGRLHVLGTGSATLTISSIFNSCESKTIKVITSYPVGTLKYVNSTGAEIQSLTMKKDTNALIKPVMSYVLEVGAGNDIECKVISTENISIATNISNNAMVENIALNNTKFTLNSSIIVSSKEKTEINTPATITLTPTVNLEETVLNTNLLEEVIEVYVTEGAKDLTFSVNNIEVSQTDIIEFTVYIHTNISLDEFSINGAGFENLIYADSEAITIIAGTPEISENIIAVPFTVKLTDVYKAYTEDVDYSITFTDSTIADRDFIFNFTVKAQKVASIFASHYNGITVTSNSITYKDPDNSNSITPGQTGILELDVYPFYANIKDIKVENTGTNEDNVTFEQIIRTTEIGTSTGENTYTYNYTNLFPRADYTENGIKVLPISKTTDIDGDTTGTAYKHDGIGYLFDGKIYLKTLIKSGVSEGSKYELTITLTTLNDVEITKVVTLTAEHTIAIEMFYSYNMERGTASDYITEVASTNENNAPTIYLPAGLENCDGTLIVNTYGFNGQPEITFSDNSKLRSKGSNGSYTFDTTECAVGESGTICAEVNIPLANGTSVKQTVYIKYQIVDIVIPNLLLQKDASTAMENILPIRIGDADQELAIFNNWLGADATDILKELTKLTKSEVEVSNNTLIVKEDKDVLEKYWFVGDDEQGTNYESLNLGESLEFITDEQGYHYLRAKNTLTNQKITCKFNYYYDNGEDNGEDKGKFKIGKPVNDASIYFTAQVSFTTDISIYTDENLPAPVYSQADFEAMQAEQHYILMNDLVLENYKPFNKEIASFDGNSFSIKISYADYSGDISSEMQDTLNLGLFEEVGENTTIKNVKVIIDEEKKIDLTNTYRSVNYGTIAAINNGVITNCSVSFENVTYSKQDDEGTEATNYGIELTTNESVAGDLVNNIGGLVAINNGYVTNSKVEQPNNIIVNIPTLQLSSSKQEQSYTPYYLVSNITSCVSKIKGNGNIAGLIATNEGIISSCYVKGIEIINNGAQSSSKNTTAGVVGENGANAKVVYSYVEGTFKQADLVRATANGIISNGNIGAFAYTNKGLISNSYANIKVTTNARASGFVYDTSANGSSVDSCFTLSAIEQNNNAHNPFTGTTTIEVLADNNISASYYLRIEKNEDWGITESEDFGNVEDEPASEIGLNELSSMGTFANYSFLPGEIETDENKYVWKMAAPQTNVELATIQTDTEEKLITYPQLITANQITLSMREVRINNSANSGTEVTGGNTVNGYPARGGTANITNVNDQNKTILAHNPYIVANEQDYVNIINNAATKNNNNADNRKVLNVVIRFVRDIEFSDSLENSPTASIIFKGALDGNGMTISNVKVNTYNLAEGQTSLGFFSELNGNPDNSNNTNERYTYGATIKNLNFEFAEVYGNTIAIVGGVVGKVENGFLLNINVSGRNVVAVGKNITGGVFGAMVGASRAVNLESSISVSSEYRYNQDVTKEYNLYESKHYAYHNGNIVENPTLLSKIDYYETKIDNINEISYAGGVGGVVDIYGSNSSETNSQTDIESIKVTGTANVLGENVGGVFGIVGSSTKIASIQNIISTPNISLYATKVAGGLVGELRGSLERSYIEHSQQAAIETTDLGRTSSYTNSTYFKGTCQTIGGIAGLLIGGTIKNCYSKVDVRNIEAQFAGGAVGRALGGKVTYTYASGSVLGKVTGGFVGHIATKARMFNGLTIENTDSTILNFNVAVNNWLFTDYEYAVLSNNAFNTFIGAATTQAELKLTGNHATEIMFSSTFNTSTKISANNGKMFNYSLEKSLKQNYCLVIAGDFAATEELNLEYEYGSDKFKSIPLTMHHPAKMVRTQEELGGDLTSSKAEIYKRFSNVLWTGKNENDLRYLKLLSRTDYFLVSVSNWGQLESAIESRADANISLANDIVVEGIIDEVYCGTLEGNGYAFVFANESEESKQKYGDKINFANSNLNNAYVNINLKATTEEEKDNQNCYGVFAVTSQAVFNNVNVRLEKTVTPDLTSPEINTQDRIADNAYIGALVAYATDYSSFNNCFIQAETDCELKIVNENENINTVYAGGLIGYLESSTILTDGSVEVITKAQSNSGSTFAVRNAEATTFANGITLNATNKTSQVNIGGLIGAANSQEAGNASEILSVTISNTSNVKLTDTTNNNSTPNNVGGLIGLATNTSISDCAVYGSVDNSNAITTELNKTTRYNNFGVVLGASQSNVTINSVTVNSNIETTITNKSTSIASHFEINAFAGNKHKNTKLLGTNSFTVSQMCNYQISDTGNYDAHNQIKLVNDESSSATSSELKISVSENSDQVIAVNPNKKYTDKDYKAENYLYGGDTTVYDIKPLSVVLKTYYKSGTYKIQNKCLTQINTQYYDQNDYDRPIFIPSSDIVGYESVKDNNIRSTFENSKMIGFIVKNDAYKTDNTANTDVGLGLYNVHSSTIPTTIYAYAVHNTNKEYRLNGVCEVIAAEAFYNAKNLTTITNTSFIEKIEDYAFAGCVNLQEADSAGIKYMNASEDTVCIFENGSEAMYNYFYSAQYIGSFAFADTKFEKLYFPCELISEITIQDNAFSHMSALNEVIIGAYAMGPTYKDYFKRYGTDRYILNTTYNNDTKLVVEGTGGRINLASNILAGSPVKIGKNLFDATPNLKHLTMPLSTYNDDGGMGDGLSYTFADVFGRGEDMNNVKFEVSGTASENVTYIGPETEWTYNSSTTLNLFVTGTTLPDKACFGMGNVNLYILSGVTTIGKYALSANLYCASLETDDPFFTGEESTDNTTIFLPSTIKYLADGMAYMRETHAKINRTVDRGGTVGSSANHLSFNQSKEDATNIPIELLHANDPSYGQTYPAFILRAQMFINVQFEDISINCIATASNIKSTGNTTFGGFGVLSYTLFEMIPNTMAPGGTLESVVTYTFNCPDRTEFVFREGETMQSNGYYYTCSDIPSIIERIDDVPCYIENTTYPYTDFPQTTVKNQGGN